MTRVFAATVLVLMLATAVSAQEGEAPLRIKSCDGTITITSNRVCMRGYEFLPVGSVNGNQIRLATTDGSAEAIIDIGASDSLCIVIIEGSLRMKMNCCWKRVFLGSHALMAKGKDPAKQRQEIAAMIRHSLRTETDGSRRGGL